jgi:hypothetical protein
MSFIELTVDFYVRLDVLPFVNKMITVFRM